MAENRTNMVSMLDIGLLMGASSNIVEMGDGFTDFSEDWAPNIETTQYVNMQNASANMKGYAFSMSPEREFLSDDMQECINYMSKHFPTGKACETFYYRFYKTDLEENVAECIKVPVIVAFSSTGGAGGDTLKATITIQGNGDSVLGKVTIDTDTGAFSWAEA